MAGHLHGLSGKPMKRNIVRHYIASALLASNTLWWRCDRPDRASIANPDTPGASCQVMQRGAMIVA